MLPSRRLQPRAKSCWYPWYTNSTCAHTKIGQHSWSHELHTKTFMWLGATRHIPHTSEKWGKGSVPQELQSPFSHRKQQFLESTTAPLQDGTGLRKKKHQATIALKSIESISLTSRFEIIQQPHWRLQDAVPFWEPSLNLLPAAYASGATGWPTLKSQAVYCGYTRLTYATLQDTQTSVPL